MDVDTLAEIAQLRQRLSELTGAGATPAAEELPPGELRVLRCQAGTEEVALLLEQLDEVVLMARVTPVPQAPPWVVGLLNVRGTTVVVLDVYARTRQVERRPHLTDMIVICRVADRHVGLVFASIDTVETVAREQLVPPPPDVLLAPYVHGIITLEGRPVFLLSIPRLVETSDLPAELQ